MTHWLKHMGRLALFATVAVAAGGCANAGDLWRRVSGGGTAPAPSAAPTDSVLAFVANAGPGMRATVPTAEGMREVRVVRAYFAASGRECREVTLALPGGPEQTRLACATGNGWDWSAPLLGGGDPVGLVRR